MNSMNSELQSILDKATSAAVDIIVAELDCNPEDMDYADRRRYARERLKEYIREGAE